MTQVARFATGLFSLDASKDFFEAACNVHALLVFGCFHGTHIDLSLSNVMSSERKASVDASAASELFFDSVPTDYVSLLTFSGVTVSSFRLGSTAFVLLL